jgi:hypothetical protein
MGASCVLLEKRTFVLHFSLVIHIPFHFFLLSISSDKTSTQIDDISNSIFVNEDPHSPRF